MRRIVMWLMSTITVVVLLFGYHTSTQGAVDQASDVVARSTTSPGTGTGSKATDGSSRGGSAGSGSAGSDSSGSGGSGQRRSTSASSVTGPTVQTQWGPVQVEVTVKGGKITDVAVPQYPSGNSNDQQINSYALPILVQETLDAQSASIDMVSGATVTSDGYLQSLQGALDAARL